MKKNKPSEDFWETDLCFLREHMLLTGSVHPLALQ